MDTANPPPPERGRARVPLAAWALLVGLLGAGWLLYARLQQFPNWEPTGTDWDQWYATALSVKTNLPYPNNRWPLNGWLILGAQALLPVPPHIAAITLSAAAMGAAGAGVFWLGARLVAWPAALVATALALGHPEVTAAGGYLGPYATWTAVTAWSALAILEATRTDQRTWWVVAGLMWAASLAVMEKGLGIGLVVGVALGLAHAHRAWKHRADGWRARLVPPVCTLVPFAGLALAYGFFPVRLWSLDEHMRLAASGDLSPAANVGGRAGWVFGQRMDPITVLETLRAGTRFAAPKNSEAVIDRIVTPDTALIVAAALGAAAALFLSLRALRAEPWRAFGWLGVAAVLAGTAPALSAAVPQARFLLPGLVVAPLVLLAPFGLLPRHAAWAAMLLLPLCLHAASPWEGRFWRALPAAEDQEWHRRRLYAQVAADTRSSLPGVPVDVISPLSGGILLVDGKGSRVIDRGDLAGVRVNAERGLIFPLPGLNEAAVEGSASALPLPVGAPDLSGRRVVASWPLVGTPGRLVLVAPVGQ
jgi:hypothetical protein